ncbi:hypothetical protein JOM56_007162 [Amanita muscaria]
MLQRYSIDDESKLFHLGLIFIAFGNLVNWLLYGTLTVQLYLYYLAFPRDKKWTKAAVYMVYFLETLQVITCAIALVTNDYTPMIVTVLGSASVLGADADLAISLVFIFLVDLACGLVPLIAQLIYAHRIQILTQKKVIPRIIRLLAIIQFFVAILSCVFSQGVLGWWCLFNGIIDMIIAFLMTRSLLKDNILSPSTRLKIIRLVYLVIATGSLTTFFNFIAFGAFAIPGEVDKFMALAVLIIMPNLYANSILVMLNNRKMISSSRNAPNRQSLSALVIADRQTMVSDIVTDVGLDLSPV